MHRPLISLLIPYLTGLLVGNYLYLPTIPTLIVITTLLIIFLVLTLLNRSLFAVVLFPVIFILIGGLLINLYTRPCLPRNHISNLVRGNHLNVQGTLYKPPKLLQDKSRLYIETERVYLKNVCIEVTGKLLLTIGETGTDLKYGDRVRFICKLRRPRNFCNPGSFDYFRYLALQGIFVTGYVKSTGDVARIGEGDSKYFRKAIEGIRGKIRNFIDSEPGLKGRGILKALLLGEKGEILEKTRDEFTAVGVAHILAISGLHLGFIAMVTFFCARAIMRFSERLMLVLDINKAAAIITIFPVLFYACIAGFGVSTFRATIMIVTFLTAIIIDRQRDLYNTLALAAFVITVIIPTSIFDVSFQLSFVSVLAILYLTPRFLYYLSLIPVPPANYVPTLVKSIGRYVGLLALVSIAATLGTGPIVAHYFNRIAPLGLIANIAIVPVVCFLVIPLSLLVAFTIFVSAPMASLLLRLDSFVVGFVVDTVNSLTMIPGLSFLVTTPTMLEIILFYLFIVFLFNLGRMKRAGYITLVLLFLITANYFYWYYTKNFNSNLRVTFIDVGQGDSALIEFPDGKRMIIDGGGFYNDSFDTGRNILASFLWKEKIKKVDYLLLSHPHPDHLNGLRFIAKNFGVTELWTNGQSTDRKPYLELMEIVKDKGIINTTMNVLTPSRYINGVKVDIYNPPVKLFQSQQIGFHSSLNNNSLVVRLTFNDASFLFTGDIHGRAEKRLIKLEGGVNSTVIKVPHHGSLTSSTDDFLAKVCPSYAVISVGHGNRFGLPNKEVVERYHNFGCKTYRTDKDGAITIVTDGEVLTIKKFGVMR